MAPARLRSTPEAACWPSNARAQTREGSQRSAPSQPRIGVLSPERKVLADSFDGKPLGRLNDLVADKKGGVYFTVGGAYYVNAAGRVTSLGENIRANGIMLSPDETRVVRHEWRQRFSRSMCRPTAASPIGVTSRRWKPAATATAWRSTPTGRLYVTSQPGVQVFDRDGKSLGLIPTPRNAISVAFAGRDKKTLYIVGSGALGADGKEFITPEGVRNNAKTIYKLSMLAEGFKGRAK